MRTKRGLSLIELMVTLAVAGLGLGVVVITLAPDRDPAEAAAEDLAIALERAGRDALLTGESIGLHLDPDGYRFVRSRLGLWTAIDAPKLYPDHRWDEDVRLSLLVEGDAVDWDRGTPPTGAVAIPPIRFDAAGSATSFEITIADRIATYRLTGDGAGAIALERSGP